MACKKDFGERPLMRLDAYLVEKGYFTSRSKAAQAIKRGEVSVCNVVRDKPSYDMIGDPIVTVAAKKNFVSLGGYKLDKALTDFDLDVSGLIFADIGASTGGFTDVLLQRGAKKVYCVDVGEGLLDERISRDDRVVVMDNTNARYLTNAEFRDALDGVVVDCSFISLRLLIPVIKKLIKNDGFIVALIKPQFESGKRSLTKNGILLGRDKHVETIRSVRDFIIGEGLFVNDITFAPTDKKKNVEYLFQISFGGHNVEDEKLLSIVDLAFSEKVNL